MYLCSVVSELSKYDRCRFVFFLRIGTGIILIGDAIQAYPCVVLADIKGCQVRDWIVGKRRYQNFTNYIYHMKPNYYLKM